MGQRCRTTSAAGRQRQQNPYQGFVCRAAGRRADAPGRRHFGCRPHERYPRRALAFSRHRPSAGTAASAGAGGARRAAPCVSRGSLRPSRTGREAGTIPRAVLFLRRRSRGDEVSAACGPQSAVPPRLELCAAGSGRQRRSRLLGSAVTADLEALRSIAGGRTDRRQVRPRRHRARWRQRERAQARRRAADRARSMAPISARRRCSLSRTITTISTTTRRPTTSSHFRRPHFMLQLARATQQMYYPEFLPDVARPRGLAWSSSADRVEGLSETLRHASATAGSRRCCFMTSAAPRPWRDRARSISTSKRSGG